MTQRPFLLALFGLLLSGLSAAPAMPLSSGISGQTLVQETLTYNLVTQQWGSTTPFHASLRVYSVGSGRLVTTVTTPAAGRFRVSLRPGYYRVVPDTMWRGQVVRADQLVIGPYEWASPITVRVLPHRIVPLTITYERSPGF